MFFLYPIYCDVNRMFTFTILNVRINLFTSLWTEKKGSHFYYSVTATQKIEPISNNTLPSYEQELPNNSLPFRRVQQSSYSHSFTKADDYPGVSSLYKSLDDFIVSFCRCIIGDGSGCCLTDTILLRHSFEFLHTTPPVVSWNKKLNYFTIT